MEADFWKQRWQANQIGFHQDQINPYLINHWAALGVPEDARVFVPLSGKSLDMRWLRERGHAVLGVELSPIAVEDFFAELGVEPERQVIGRFQACKVDGLALCCGDFFDLDAAQLADIGAVYDRASLVALPPPMRPAYARHLVSILPRSVPVLLVTMEYPDGQMQGPPFTVHEDEVRQLYAAHFDIEMLEQQDILEQSPQFRAKGVKSLLEKVFLLRPRSDQQGHRPPDDRSA